VNCSKVVLLALLVLARAWPADAQQTVDYASISGRVTDPSGAVIAGAEVSARNTATNVAAAAITDQEGRFRFPYLRVGGYEITARRQGFEMATRKLALSVGSAFEITLMLPLSGVDASVDVAAEVTILESARSQIASTVSEPEVRALPLNGRNFLELALLVPGVSATNVSSTQLFPETSAVPGVSLSVGSQRNFSNNFIVDGLSANDDAAGLSGITYGLDAVDQFQIVTSGAQAELGRALGGYVNVVTKSGTNVLHGTAYNYVRDDRFNARNALSRTRLPMHQMQYGGSIGGPLVANRTFYFGNLEQRRLEQSGLTTIPNTTASAINAHLCAVGSPGPPVTTGMFPTPVDSTSGFVKLDHQVGGRDQISVRYSVYDVRSENSRGAGGLNAPSASAALDNLDHMVAVGNTHTISSRTVLETRAQIAHGNLQAPPSDLIGPAVSIAGVAAFGTSSGAPTERTNTLYQIVTNLSHQAGAHALRAGADVLYNDDRITYPRANRGSYTFSSLANFLAGRYNNAGFTQTFGPSEVSQTNPNVGVYVQDEWKIDPRFTLNAGLRYDVQFLDTIATDANNLSPRAGVVWAPFAARQTLVRASAGLFFDRVPLRPLANAILSAGNTTELSNLRQIIVTLSPGQTSAPGFPGTLPSAVPSGTLVNLTTMARHLQNAYSRQASAEVEQQLGDRITISVGYEYLRGLNLLMSINQNVPSCVAAGDNNGCRPVAQYANNNQYSSAGESNYQGLHVSFAQRPSAWGHYRVSYTLSKSMNNVGEFFFSSPIDPFDLSKDWARSDDDQRHRLVISGAIQTSAAPASGLWDHIKNGFQFGGMVQASSGLPFNITSGVTTVQGTAGRPIVAGEFIPRNAGESSPFFTFNARVSRTFPVKGRVQLEMLVEGFNLTNHVNVVTRNTNFGAGAYPTNPSPGFGQITGVGEARSFQFAARVRF
jgi:carboxypeptidase family protein/TonB-dependent receptor-like protein